MLATLEPQTRALAVKLLTAARNAGYPLIITSARRSQAEQLALVRSGASRDPHSEHLTGRAFDVDLFGVARSRVSPGFWSILGPFAERLGLAWGGRWRSPYDPGHFELAAVAFLRPIEN